MELSGTQVGGAVYADSTSVTPEGNSPAALQLGQELEQKHQQAHERLAFLRGELDVWSSVERACTAALKSLNEPRTDGPAF